MEIIERLHALLLLLLLFFIAWKSLCWFSYVAMYGNMFKYIIISIMFIDTYCVNVHVGSELEPIAFLQNIYIYVCIYENVLTYVDSAK